MSQHAPLLAEFANGADLWPGQWVRQAGGEVPADQARNLATLATATADAKGGVACPGRRFVMRHGRAVPLPPAPVAPRCCPNGACPNSTPANFGGLV